MNTTDIGILLGVLFFVVLGFRDGLMKKVFGTLGFLGGLICATKFMGDLGGTRRADYYRRKLGTVLFFFSPRREK